MVNIPRFMIAAPASGQGKTMLTISILAALKKRGLQVAPNKVGPDYIDPGYHTLATGRVSRNLDPILCPEPLLAPLLLHGAITPTPADVAVIEGVMGLFDGKLETAGQGSSAHVAKLTETPIVLCVDGSHTSRTAAAVVAGLAGFDPELNVAGVIFNKVSSPRHAGEIRDAMARVPVEILGFVPNDKNAETPSRHLGLIPAEERPEAAAGLAKFSELIADHVDLDRLLAIANQAPELDAEPWDPTQVVQAPSDLTPVVAVAGGKAFTFRFAETTELLRAGGCEVIEFDPTEDHQLPANTCGLYLGGGFPEMHAEQISGNAQLRLAIRSAVHSGVPTVAECAGMLYLAKSLDGQPMTGALDLVSKMAPRLAMGYRTAIAPQDTLLAKAGDEITGNEFHRTQTLGTYPMAAWQLSEVGPAGVSADPADTGCPTVHASYLHTHWAGYPFLAQHFIDAVHKYAQEHS